MELLDFDTNPAPTFSWRDSEAGEPLVLGITAEEAQPLAVMEDAVRQSEKALRFGVSATHLTANGRQKLAEKKVADYNRCAGDYLSSLAIEHNAVVDLNYQPLRTVPEAKLYEALPLLFSPGIAELNKLKALRYASSHRLQHGKLLTLEAVTTAVGISTEQLSRIENEERGTTPKTVDRLLAYYCGLNAIEGEAKFALYRRFSDELGYLALPDNHNVALMVETTVGKRNLILDEALDTALIESMELSGPQAEIFKAMPLLDNEAFRHMPWFRALRMVSAYNTENGQPLTQEAVAKATGFSAGYLSRIENGKRFAPPDTVGVLLNHICEVNGLKAEAKIAFFERYNEQLGNPTKPELAKMANVELPVELAA